MCNKMGGGFNLAIVIRVGWSKPEAPRWILYRAYAIKLELEYSITIAL